MLLSSTAALSAVTVDSSGCTELNPEKLQELVQIELNTLGLASQTASLSVRCQAQLAEVSLRDTAGSVAESAAKVDLSTTDRGSRERLVALAATELVAQAERPKAEPLPQAPPRKQPRATAPAPAAPHARAVGPEHAVGSFELFGAASLVRMGHPATTLMGGALGARLEPVPHVSIWFDLRLEAGQTEISDLSVDWAMLSSSAALATEKQFGALRVGVGTGIRLARLAWTTNATPPDIGHGLTGFWLGATLPLRAAVILSEHLGLLTSLETGYVLVPIRGTVEGEAPLVEVRGAWGSVALGAMAIF